jgi:hypothetical protein
MSITPVGGWNRPETRASKEEELVLFQRRAPGTCPSCDSTEWKSASLVHAEGLSTTKISTRGRTLGVGRAGFQHGQFLAGGGTYTAKTRGSSQTILSSMAEPPRKRNGLIGFLIIMGLLFGVRAVNEFQLTSDAVILVVVSAGLFFGAFRLWARQQEVYEEAVETYTQTRVCQRCGTFYEA